MLFEREAEALRWYESEERVLNKGFLDTIPWHEMKQHELKPEFLPVLVYMRDIENFTSIYFDQLSRPPTVKDPAIRDFMERWRSEEGLHGDLLNRFLEEAGYPTSGKWEAEARAKIPASYKWRSRLNTRVTNLFGKHFTAVHMTWGAINELSTLNGYNRLWQLAKHPVLEHILRGIVREEARHSFFYWSIARIKLIASPFRQKLTRFIIDRFWSPVGEGTKPKSDSNLVIKTLFAGAEGIRLMDQRVNQQIERLPGLAGLKTVTQRISSVSSSRA